MKRKFMKKVLYFLFFFANAPLQAFATDKYGMSDVDVIIYQAGGTDNPSILGVIGAITQWLLGFVGALSVLIIVIAGIMYMTSGGDEGRIETAKKWLIYAIVGLVVALLGWVIVNTVINAL